MTEIKWTDDLSCGVSWIDTQHKNLIGRIVKLNHAIELGRASLEVNQILDFLEDYTHTHFSMEEKEMLKHGYPEYAFHQEEHVSFIKTLKELKKESKKLPANKEFFKDLQYELWEYFRNHVQVVDAAFSRFLRDK